ncbi:hypothetical protein MMC07_009653 [Pseudocyphellaria aurata]|nr:hypothetical protein [Pseudocyphellaria aurata]
MCLLLAFLFRLAFGILFHFGFVSAQESVFQSLPKTTPNSADAILAEQSAQLGRNWTSAGKIALALNFERSNWANGSVADDDFYRVPSFASTASAGTLLKVQLDANTSAYTLPPNTAISRIMYQTETLNGTTVPASAYILWPYLPLSQSDGYRVVVWGHGMSGIWGDCAPSHLKNLLYQFASPYTLVLRGYVVVAPDYAGLGVAENAEKVAVNHTWFPNRSHANDLFYSVQAAQSGFAEVSKQFVIMGHSQGGGAAWAAAQRQAVRPVEGYLGAIAASPPTKFMETAKSSLINNVACPWTLVQALLSIFPDFDPGDILTPAGLQRYQLYAEIQGCNSVMEEIVDSTLVRSNWSETFYPRAFSELSQNGGQPIAGPLLILQGADDPAVLADLVTKYVNQTCDLYPNSQLEYIIFEGVKHLPLMYASQPVWLSWIEERFAEVEVRPRCLLSRIASARPIDSYQHDVNWIIKYSTEGYETA